MYVAIGCVSVQLCLVSILRLRAPTCLGLPTHGALSQIGFFCSCGCTLPLLGWVIHTVCCLSYGVREPKLWFSGSRAFSLPPQVFSLSRFSPAPQPYPQRPVSVTARLTLRGGAGARGGGVWTWRSSLENLVWYQGSGVVPSSRSNFPQPHVLYLALHKHDANGKGGRATGDHGRFAAVGVSAGSVWQRRSTSEAQQSRSRPGAPAWASA